jgi:hypothetical protein
MRHGRRPGVVVLGLLITGAAFALCPVASADHSWTLHPANTDGPWEMPSLIGNNLQQAKDAIPALTEGQIWQSSTTDLTGQRRTQVPASSWVVCSSTPPPGGTLTLSTNINFGAVRSGETCPPTA